MAEAAAQQGREPGRKGKTEARTLDILGSLDVETFEVPEQPLAFLGRYARTSVHDFYPQHLAVRHLPQAHIDSAVAGELHRIAKQVEQHLAQPCRIGNQLLPGTRRHLDAQCQTLGIRGRANQIEAFDRDRPHVKLHRLQLDILGFDLGQVEHAGDHLQQVPASHQHRVHLAALRGVQAVIGA